MDSVGSIAAIERELAVTDCPSWRRLDELVIGEYSSVDSFDLHPTFAESSSSWGCSQHSAAAAQFDVLPGLESILECFEVAVARERYLGRLESSVRA